MRRLVVLLIVLFRLVVLVPVSVFVADDLRKWVVLVGLLTALWLLLATVVPVAGAVGGRPVKELNEVFYGGVATII